jgi:di/tricarboxylate transporter
MSVDAWLTIGILILTFVALLATKLPPATVFLGALTLSVTFDLAPLDRSLTLRLAARSIDYGTLFVLGAAIGVAAAVSESGLAAEIAALLTRLGGGDPTVALAVVFIGRIVMANLITNTASAVFLFPIALSIADQLGVSFMPFAIALMTGTIGAAITPAAYQTNLMVYGPGEYAFADFVKMGIPLTLLVGVMTIWLAPVFFPF